MPAPTFSGSIAVSPVRVRPRISLRPILFVVRSAFLFVLGFAAILAATLTVPSLLGYRTLTVMSGSMAPALRTGDLVVAKQLRPDEARIGDVVTFRSPGGDGRLITHRVRWVARNGRNVSFATQGDANPTSERWSAPTGGTIGRVELRVPKLGVAFSLVGSRDARLAAVLLPALLLAGAELWRIWRPKRRR